MFELKPFQPFAGVTLQAGLRVQGRQIVVEYHLNDPQNATQDGMHDGRWAKWERADELWKTTCFELFLGHPKESGYWEFNFSPAAEKWNCYAFDDYRRPQPPNRSDDFQLSMAVVNDNCLKCELNSIVPLSNIEASLTSVIRTKQGVNYFAVKHAGPKADFHLRDSFVIKL